MPASGEAIGFPWGFAFPKAGNPRNAPCRALCVLSTGFRIQAFDLLQNVKCGARESRICGQKGSRWKIGDSRALEPGQLASGKRLLLDRCTWEGKLMRKGGLGVSAIGASGFPFAFPAEVLFVLQMGK